MHASFFFSSRRRHTISTRDWSSDVCSSDLGVLDRHAVGEKQISRRFDEVFLELGETVRSEERRVGKEGRSRWSPYHSKKIDFFSIHDLSDELHPRPKLGEYTLGGTS